MGDGLMALFGAMENNQWQTADAVKAALAMRDALAAYNEALAARDCRPCRSASGSTRATSWRA
jgi:class 3 adenylate cyclase